MLYIKFYTIAFQKKNSSSLSYKYWENYLNGLFPYSENFVMSRTQMSAQKSLSNFIFKRNRKSP